MSSAALRAHVILGHVSSADDSKHVDPFNQSPTYNRSTAIYYLHPNQKTHTLPCMHAARPREVRREYAVAADLTNAGLLQQQPSKHNMRPYCLPSIQAGMHCFTLALHTPAFSTHLPTLPSPQCTCLQHSTHTAPPPGRARCCCGASMRWQWTSSMLGNALQSAKQNTACGHSACLHVKHACTASP